jgi:hypothetical protein
MTRKVAKAKVIKGISSDLPAAHGVKGKPTLASQTIKPSRRAAALLGFLAKGEVHAIFEQLPFQPANPADSPLDLWRKSNEGRSHLHTPLATQPDTLPDEAASVVEAIKKRATYKRSYESVADYHFGVVPASALLAPQWFVDLDYVDELAARVKVGMHVTSLIDFTMSEGMITQPIVTHNQVLFTSPRRDLCLDGIPDVRDVGGGELELVLRAFSRPNYVQVAVLDGKLLLVNGVHKVLALHARGYNSIPCIWRRAHNLMEAGFDPRSTSLFADQTFNSPRPAMVLDFLNDLIAVPLIMRSQYQVLRVSINAEMFQTPAVQG